MSTHSHPGRDGRPAVSHHGDHVLSPRETALLVSAFLALGLSILSVLTI